jgi:putative CocE/NonD family hydrolase
LSLKHLLPALALLVLAVAAPAQTPEKTPRSVSFGAAQLDSLSGEYTDYANPDTPLSFYAKEGKLWFEGDRQPPTELVSLSKTDFLYEEQKTTFRFTGTGVATELSVAVPGQPDTAMHRTGKAVHHVFHHYVRTVADIPARDGVKLHLVILTPTDMPGPLPILLSRTPYSVDGNSGERFIQQRSELAREGYIYVNGDIRGRFGSEGTFTMMHPLQGSNSASATDPKATDESTDAYDTIDWAIKNLPNNNGRVGVLGTSYPGFLSMMAGIHPHPAVKAISPQAPMIDVWMGDDFFHNGAFRQTYGYDYAIELESNKGRTDVSYGNDAKGNPRDGFDFFLERGSFAEDMKQSGVKKQLPTWQAFVEHPSYDSVWQAKAVWPHLTEVAVPTLTVGGYYDQEDMYGPQKEYSTLEPHDTNHQNFLVLGPWRHGSWASSSRHLGALQYGESIGNTYRAQIEAKFFAKYLKDKPGFDLEDTASFQTGSNQWRLYPHFPPAEAKPTPLSLCGTGVAALDKPCPAGKRSYVSDPANPIPYRHRPIEPTYGEGSKWGTWMVEDQRFVTSRKDIALYKLPVLDHDLTITGEVIADLFASTTGSDGDFVAKLIDQYPDKGPDADADPTMSGFQLMTNMEIFRGRYRNSFEKPEALKPNEVTEIKWSLHDVDHVFKKGHTILVEIQSTWFPLYDRNPQTFVPNIMLAKPEDYKPETITIYNDEQHNSKLILPVIAN